MHDEVCMILLLPLQDHLPKESPALELWSRKKIGIHALPTLAASNNGSGTLAIDHPLIFLSIDKALSRLRSEPSTAKKK